MVKLVSAKCPNCGAALKLSKEKEKVKCEYCKNTIIVEEAIACFKLKVTGNINVDGVSTNAELIEAANELLNMNEYLKAKRKFLEFSEKCPDNYQGWLGLLICRTRNFTIKDNNIMFENDVNKYRDHFFKVAPEDIKEQYFEIIDRYFDPEKYIRLMEEEKEKKRKEELEKIKKQVEEKRKHVLEKKEKYKSKIVENSSFKTIKDFIQNGIFFIFNVFLYGLGGIIVFGCLLSIKENFLSNFLAILFGLSLFKIFYSIIEKKFNINKNYLLVSRFLIPFLLMILLSITLVIEGDQYIDENKVINPDEIEDVPVQDNQNKDNNSNNNQVEVKEEVKETIYYIKYNELGNFGKYKEFEKKNVIFYYFPDGKYKIEATSLNENICFLWIDYDKGYQNGNYGTAYDTKETLKFTSSSKVHTINLDSSVHIYNSNNCNYKLTLTK